MKEIKDQTSRIERDVLEEHKPSLRYIARLWRYVFSSAKLMCMIFLALTILLALLRPLMAFLWRKYVDSANLYISGETILPILSLAIGYFLLNFLSDLIYRYTEGYEDIESIDLVQRNRFQEKLDAKMYRKIASMSAEHTDIPKINDTMARVFGFTSAAWEGLSEAVIKPGYLVIAKLVSVISIAASLYVVSPWLCLILIAAPLPTLYTTFVSNKLEFKFVKDNAKLKREIDYFQKLMIGGAVKEIKVLTLFDFFYDKWKTRVDEYTVRENRNYLKRMALNTSSNLITGLAAASANILAIVLMTMGRISLGALSAAISLTGTLLTDTSTLFAQAATLLSKKNEAAMFFDLMDLPGERQDGQEMKGVETIRAQDLSYRYPMTGQYVLSHVSLTVQKGEKVAFVGENGAGKTTFVKLLSGLLQPSCGTLQVNGIDSTDLNPQGRYRASSSVTQDPARYTTLTVADNVYLGDSSKPRDEAAIGEAIAFAGLEDVPADLLLGKDIGGSDLSGGQWQKLAIARGIYRGKDFMILDEPTGNLDPLAEAAVFEKYLELSKDKTVIMVTHRISVAALADRIVVFSGGGIAEDGTHDELMAKDGVYAKLYHTQAQWYER